MEIFSIDEKTEYLKELFEKEKYDSFYLYEARVKTKLDYYVNGRLNREYFDTEEQADLPEYVEWKDIKQIVYSYIKGKRLPIGFKIILMFNRENILRLLEMNNLPVKTEDVSALFMNVVYEHEALSVTTGTSLKIFTMDKTLEHVWDDTVKKYYI
ncbi:DUF5721 family protein [Eubacterium sp. MSJ-33]|uniref:DUF5721 family protein n=1 Tax=Eubacterium sp. MSJ-33 TaxID=2841528 RepID=UPI001C77FDD5|nr:DUF5721 family protein [Eubacterium sp. MSJ-33]QWT53173.1 hypothetical protein KP625_00645 [Eubacterium sp. MSJ-33]